MNSQKKKNVTQVSANIDNDNLDCLDKTFKNRSVGINFILSTVYSDKDYIDNLIDIKTSEIAFLKGLSKHKKQLKVESKMIGDLMDAKQSIGCDPSKAILWLEIINSKFKKNYKMSDLLNLITVV